jgi:hypothetical protein
MGEEAVLCALNDVQPGRGFGILDPLLFPLVMIPNSFVLG